MSDYTRNTVGSGYNTATAINAELQKIEVATNSKMDKSGGTFTGDVDLANNDLLNGGSANFLSITLNGVAVTTSNLGVVTIPDSSAINFTQAGTGAVQRTVSSKLQETITATDYGASEDGTDDSAAIQDAIDQAVASGTSFTSDYYRRNPVTLRVGASGNFSTLNEALEYAEGLKPIYQELDGSNNTTKLVINLETGFTLAEQVFIYEKDLSWIEITSTDATVTITRSAIADQPNVTNWVTGYTPVFTAMRNAKLPTISCLFSMDTSGTATGNRIGIFLHEGSTGVVTRTNGIQNCDGRGVEVSGSIFYGRETDFSGSLDTAYRFSNGSLANIRQSDGSGSVRGLYVTSSVATAIDCDFSNCSEYAIYATGASLVHAADTAAGTANLSGAGVHGVFSEDGSIVNVQNANIGTATNNGIDARSGSRVLAEGATLTGAGSNEFSKSGGADIIFGAFGTELTIATGAISISSRYHKVDTESDAATDDLDTINGGYVGDVITLQAISNTRTVVVKHNTGNIFLNSLADFSLDSSRDTITLVYTGSEWCEVARSNNG